MQPADLLPVFTSGRASFLVGFGVFALLGALAFFPHSPDASRGQPIAFNHAKHIDNGMTCTDCHPGAQDEVRASLPTLATCLTCHEASVTQSVEETKLRALAVAGKELAWTQLTRVPAHVYFSHRRHVQLAKLSCASCHGPIEKAITPPREPYRPMKMDTCIRCHERSGAKTDCNDCHR